MDIIWRDPVSLGTVSARAARPVLPEPEEVRENAHLSRNCSAKFSRLAADRNSTRRRTVIAGRVCQEASLQFLAGVASFLMITALGVFLPGTHHLDTCQYVGSARLDHGNTNHGIT